MNKNIKTISFSQSMFKYSDTVMQVKVQICKYNERNSKVYTAAQKNTSLHFKCSLRFIFFNRDLERLYCRLDKLMNVGRLFHALTTNSK